jgi:hypothetical protein
VRKNNILRMIHIIFLSYLFSNICIIKKVTNKKNLRTIIGFGTAFNNIGLGTCLALGFGIAMQKRNSNTQESPPKK